MYINPTKTHKKETCCSDVASEVEISCHIYQPPIKNKPLRTCRDTLDGAGTHTSDPANIKSRKMTIQQANMVIYPVIFEVGFQNAPHLGSENLPNTSWSSVFDR